MDAKVIFSAVLGIAAAKIAVRMFGLDAMLAKVA